MNAWHRRLVGFALANCACGAYAHSPVAGMNHFYSGMVHPVLVPAHVIALAVSGLWIGLGPGDDKTHITLLGAAAVGLILGIFVTLPAMEQFVLTLATVMAIAVALHWLGPSAVRLGVVACLGVLLGLDSKPDGLSGSQLWISLGGTWLTIALIVAAMILLCQVAVRSWQRIALRVIASWLAASALVVVALVSFKPAQTAAPNRSGAVMQR